MVWPWTEDVEEEMRKAYRDVGAGWALRVPHFDLPDFVKFTPRLWQELQNVEKEIDNSNGTATPNGLLACVEKWRTLWFAMIGKAEAETERLKRMGLKLPEHRRAGLRILGDDASLARDEWAQCDGVTVKEVLRWLNGECSSEELLGTVKKRKVDSIPSLDLSLSEKIIWREKENIDSIPSLGIEEKPLIVELDLQLIKQEQQHTRKDTPVKSLPELDHPLHNAVMCEFDGDITVAYGD